MTTRARTPFFAAALALALAAPAAHADEKAELERLRATTLALIEALVNQGLLSRERADGLLRQAQAAPAKPAEPQWGTPPAAGAPGAPRTIRVPYVSETLRAQLKDEIRNEVLSTAREERWADARQVPEWVRGLQIEGDLRLRWQAERYDQPQYLRDGSGAIVGGSCDIVGGNLPAECYRQQNELASSPAWAPDLLNTTNNRERLVLRARLGINAKVGDDTSLGLRLSTGSNSGPTSSSQTLGSHFNKAGIVIDRAFLRWEPRHDVRFIGGRMANPFFGSDLLWPEDLSFDGAALQGELNLVPGAYAFATLGAFPLEEFNVDRRDKWLYALQLGADWALADKLQWRIGLASYRFVNVEGVRENEPAPGGSRAGTVPYLTSQYPSNVRLKGNTLINLNDPTSTAAPTWGLASRFRPLNLTTQLALKVFDPLEATLALDWVRNSAFDIDDIRRRAGGGAFDGLQARTTGLQVKGSFGHARPSNNGEWQFSAALRKFERDAWVDGFTDPTWHLGGTGYKGWQIGGLVAFDRRTTLGLRVTSTRNLDDGVRYTDPVSGVVSGNLSSAPLKIDVFQIDLNSRF
ncbi:MAG: putative porin [Rubrivivax sp.]